jgi:Ca2+-binding RTX toxin-like protein
MRFFKKLTIMAVLGLGLAGVVMAMATAAHAKIITGTNQDDKLVGTANQDQINGIHGDDIIFGKGSTDDLSGGRGSDKIYGGARLDDITGGRGYDTLYGGRGYDVLHSYDGGVDRVVCGPGSDEVFADYDPLWVMDNIANDCEYVNGRVFAKARPNLP